MDIIFLHLSQVLLCTWIYYCYNAELFVTITEYVINQIPISRINVDLKFNEGQGLTDFFLRSVLIIKDSWQL